MLKNLLRIAVPLLLAALPALTGCGGQRAAEVPAAQDVPAEVSAPAPDLAEDGVDSTLFTGYEVCGVAQEDAQVYTVSAPNESAIIAGASAEYAAVRLSVDKSGDASDPEAQRLTGTNAAVAAVHGGTLALDSPVITAGGSAAHALYVSGDGSAATVTNAAIVVTGAYASALYASDGGRISVSGGELRGAAAPVVSIFGGTVECDGVSVVCDGTAASVLDLRGGGTLRFSGGTATGDLRFGPGGGTLACTGATLSGNLVTEEDAEAQLSLSGGASLTGSIDSEGGVGVLLQLDAQSRFTMTADCYVAVLEDADATLLNIQSGGHSLYYNSEDTRNAWLGGRTLELPGGGFLIPMI